MISYVMILQRNVELESQLEKWKGFHSERVKTNAKLREALQHLSEFLDYHGYHEKVKYIQKVLEGG